MTEFVEQWFAHSEAYAGRIFLAALAIAFAEYLLPQSRYSLMSRIRGALFWAVYIPITASGLILFSRVWKTLGVSPLFHVDLSFLSTSDFQGLAVLGGVATSLAIIQVTEFFYYWFHRVQHSSRFFWRFHAEHHSLAEMNAWNSNHHFTEELFRIPFITIPLSLLLSFEQGYVPWIWAFLMGWQGIYEHSATKIHFGWFRYVVPDNRFHRIHHSKDRKHFNKNFGSGTPLWDMLFRTAYYPRNDEWPETGLAGMDEPKSLREFLFRPFLSKQKATNQDGSEPVTSTPEVALMKFCTFVVLRLRSSTSPTPK